MSDNFSVVSVRLFSGANWQDAIEGDDYEFAQLPKIGERLTFHFDDRVRFYRVVDIDHVFKDHMKPAKVGLLMDEIKPS